MSLWEVWVARSAQSLTGWLILLALATLVELVASRGGKRSGSLLGLSFWLVWVPVTIGIDVCVQYTRDTLGIAPMIVLPLDLGLNGIWAILVASVLTAFGGDLIFYWVHRAQHKWFWRFHAVHHSISNLSAINSYHHVSEEIIRAVLMVAPLSFVVADTTNLLPVLTAILWLQSIYIHSDIKYNFGPLRCILLDNCFHRIHHSIESQHFDRNFAAFTTLWDRVFGTAWMPQRGEWPDTGIAEAAQPSNIWQWLSLPFRIKATPPDVEIMRTERV